jgi:RAD51-like protein 2
MSVTELSPLVKFKLHRAGYRTIGDLVRAQTTASELSSELAIGLAQAEDALRVISCLEAGQMMGGHSALELLQQEQARGEAVVTMCEELDEALGGGVPVGQVCEVFGPPGVGKTQLAMQLALAVQIPRALHGLEGEALYVDTEGSFVAERMLEMASALQAHLRQLTKHQQHQHLPPPPPPREATEFLRAVHVCRMRTPLQLAALLDALPLLLRPSGRLARVRLLILDSIAALFRLPIISPDTPLQAHQQHQQPPPSASPQLQRMGADAETEEAVARTRLTTHLGRQLARLAEQQRLAVLVVNQVTTRMRDSRLVPSMGEAWGHLCGLRLQLEWAYDRRYARLLKSPNRPPALVPFALLPDGVRSLQQQQPPPPPDSGPVE